MDRLVIVWGGVLAALLGTAAPAVAQLDAEFSATPTSGPNPLTVRFTDQTTGAGASAMRVWQFGDGASSLEQDPVHTYDAPGSYTVSLLVLDGILLDAETKRDLVTVEPALIDPAIGAAPTQGVHPLTVQFDDASTGTPAESWLWDFGDGETSDEPSVAHGYTAPGTYTASLTVSVGGEFITVVEPDLIQIDPAPLFPDFTATPVSGKVPLEVAFTDATMSVAPDDYLWDFGDGSTSSQVDPVHTYGAPGTSTVSLQVSLLDQVETVVMDDLVQVDPAPLFPAFTAAPTTGPAPLSVAFTNTSTGDPPDNLLWDFGDGTFSIASDPVHVFAGPGTYSVSLKLGIAEQVAEVEAPDLITTGPPDVGPLYAEVDQILDDAWLYVPVDVAAFGGTLLVGGLTLGAVGRAVEVFDRRRDGRFEPVAALHAEHVSLADQFGARFCLSGDQALIGAPLDDGVAINGGAAYVFERDAAGCWSQTARLIARDGALNDRFGISLAIERNVALVGADRADGEAPCSGVVYGFERTPDGRWEEVARLSAPDGVTGGAFGETIVMSQGRALVAASASTAGDDGVVYAYDRLGPGEWRLVGTLAPSDPSAAASFGSALAIDGDRALIGAETGDGATVQTGSVFVFERQGNAWVEVARLAAESGMPSDFFGRAVALSGDLACVGAPFHDALGSNAGAVFVFERAPSGAWNQVARLLASDGGPSGIFGTGVALMDGTVLATGISDVDETPPSTWKLYVFDPTGAAPGAGLALSRVPSEAPGDRSLRITGASPGAVVWLATGAPVRGGGSEGGITALSPPLELLAGPLVADATGVVTAWLGELGALPADVPLQAFVRDGDAVTRSNVLMVREAEDGSR